MTQAVARNLSMIILTLKVMKELGYSSVKNGKELGMKTLQARNQLRSFRFQPRETVTINIGLIKSTDKNNYNLGPIRGSRLPVKVQKTFTAAKVLSAGILKHSNHDEFFCSSEDCLLLYPDQKVVTNIPGSEELFTAEKYKKELGKRYSKLDLSFCRASDISIGNSGSLSNLNETKSTASAAPV